MLVSAVLFLLQTLKRLRRLHEQNVIPDRDLMEAQDDYDRAQEGLRVSQGALEYLMSVTGAVKRDLLHLEHIAVDEQANVLHLPRGAVRGQDGGYVVLTGSTRAPRSTTVQGRFFGDDRFIVEDGLDEGDRVLIERRRSR